MKRLFSEVYLELNCRIKDMHQAILAKKNVDAYLISCDVTELAQELEDILQFESNKN